MIKKTKSGYVLKSHTGKKTLGKFDSKEEALKRERQINYFKNKKK